MPIERNDHTEPNAEAFIFGFDFPSPGLVSKVDWQKVDLGEPREVD